MEKPALRRQVSRVELESWVASFEAHRVMRSAGGKTSHGKTFLPDTDCSHVQSLLPCLLHEVGDEKAIGSLWCGPLLSTRTYALLCR